MNKRITIPANLLTAQCLHFPCLRPTLRILASIALLSFGLNRVLSAAPTGSDSALPHDAAPVAWAGMNSKIDNSDASARRIPRWRDARFGLFIHFGLYAIPGKGEWLMWNDQMDVREYSKLADSFSLDRFNADEWASIAKNAGMKYMVLTAKHHDGFALFDSSAPDGFNSVKTAAHRDIVKEYTDAARKQGMMVGLYYSPLDWRYPGWLFPDVYRESAEAMREKYHTQMRELMSNYGPIDILWYDGGGENWLGFGGIEWKHGWRPREQGVPYHGNFSWKDDEINGEVRRLQPNLVLNDRTRTPADFKTRENESRIGDFNNKTPWELCAPLAGCWGYRPGKTPLSRDHVIQLLVRTVGRDGNLMLNVGPRPDGQIEPDQAARLKEVGDWLAVYGESIYGTRGGPYLPREDNLLSTRKGNAIFLHVLAWPASGPLKLPSPGREIVKATLLSGVSVHLTDKDKGIEIEIPPEHRESPDTIIRLELDGSAMDLAPAR